MTVGIRLTEKLAFTRRKRDSSGARAIAVTLPAELTRKIRNGYFKPVSAILMRQLGQPARAAYRVLDSLRHDPAQHQSKTSTLQLSLMDLAQLCGIAAERTDKIRRTLEPIHTNLLESGYLQDVQITGRGNNQPVSYVFGQLALEPDGELVALLVSFKVSLVDAKKAALDYPENVRDAVTQARAPFWGAGTSRPMRWALLCAGRRTLL